MGIALKDAHGNIHTPLLKSVVEYHCVFVRWIVSTRDQVGGRELIEFRMQQDVVVGFRWRGAIRRCSGLISAGQRVACRQKKNDKLGSLPQAVVTVSLSTIGVPR